jgi:hypothetical protein
MKKKSTPTPVKVNKAMKYHLPKNSLANAIETKMAEIKANHCKPQVLHGHLSVFG